MRSEASTRAEAHALASHSSSSSLIYFLPRENLVEYSVSTLIVILSLKIGKLEYTSTKKVLENVASTTITQQASTLRHEIQ